MSSRELLGVAIAVLVYACPAPAYKAMTHKAITNHVASRTTLSNEELMSGMGFGVVVPEEVDSLLITNDKGDDQCDSAMRDSNIKHFYCGAAFEDIGLRSFNHFYDPVRDLPLHRLGVPLSGFRRSPDWALEDAEEYNSQDFSLRDAYRYFLGSKTQSSQGIRGENEQKLFLALGHVVHHLQDMAQPAHVRNDMHCDAEVDRLTRCLGFLVHDPSIYERSTEYVYNNLPLTGYMDLNLNNFRKVRDFWSTGSQWHGIGMSEFANWNFVSQDTNFIYVHHPLFPTDQPDFYPSPFYDNPVPNSLTSEPVVSPVYGDLGIKWFVGNQVTDQYRPEQSGVNDKASTLSIFHSDLQEYEYIPHPENLFTLNEETFSAARSFLIPRTVAYSAGLVNYFFRGQMKVTGARIYNTGSTITDSLGVTIVNASSEHTPGNAPFDFSDGRFRLYYETLQGERRSAAPHDRDEVALGQTDVLRDQEDKYLSYQIPISQWDRTKPMTLIFDGIVGEERGIVVKEFYPDPLLAFSVDGLEGDSPVPNIITVSASYDMGFTWEYKGAFYKPVSDTTLFTGNRVLVHNAINLGEGELLVHFSYIDYMDDEGNIMTGRSENSMARSTDYGQTWELVDFAWQPLLVGAALGSDVFSVYESIVYTGEQGLAGIRIQHPEERGEPRSFQLFQSNALGVPGSWIGAPGLGTGGLPELDYLGSSSFGFAGYLEGDPPGGREGGDFPFDSIMVRTDDGGASYYPLTDFSSECGDPNDPDNKVTYCIQHFEYLGDERLLGWVDLRSESLADYHNGLAFHLSSDGGMTWLSAMNAPFDQACESLPVWEGRVENAIYIGKSPEDKDVMMALTRCQEVYEDSSSGSPRVYWDQVVGKSLFFTRDGGVQWYKVRLPGEFNNESVLLYAGDNGAIPGLYHPEI
ncbi:MAG: hypothetical protein AB2745_14075 [Candidatus Thiodiazotropha endolucinida]